VGLANINSQTDAELLLKVADHDTVAFEQLYDRYSSPLYSLIKKIVIEKEVAEKILREVFIIVWKRIDDFAFETDNVYTWLVLLARNKALDVLKRRRGNTVLPEYDEEFERFNIIPNISKEIKTIRLDDALKVKNDLGEIISGLTDAQRYVLSLFYFDGLSESEVAEKLKIPVPTVKSKLQVAVEILLEKTNKLVPDNG
jgi:RNA polymerase sigma-70 factor (ECF subfamily)